MSCCQAQKTSSQAVFVPNIVSFWPTLAIFDSSAAAPLYKIKKIRTLTEVEFLFSAGWSTIYKNKRKFYKEMKNNKKLLSQSQSGDKYKDTSE